MVLVPIRTNTLSRAPLLPVSLLLHQLITYLQLRVLLLQLVPRLIHTGLLIRNNRGGSTLSVVLLELLNLVLLFCVDWCFPLFRKHGEVTLLWGLQLVRAAACSVDLIEAGAAGFAAVGLVGRGALDRLELVLVGGTARASYVYGGVGSRMLEAAFIVLVLRLLPRLLFKKPGAVVMRIIHLIGNHPLQVFILVARGVIIVFVSRSL